MSEEKTIKISREDVKEYYGKAGDTPQPGLCCPTLYSKDDVSHIPQDVMDVSYGCGSPVTLADIQPGETLLDLGSGGGVDCFIASKMVGKNGKVIGIDMTPEMMVRAIKNASTVGKNLGFYNVEFRHGFLEDIPVDSSSVDVVTSNCVVNLSTNKKKVFEEIKRILKPGGRFVISDIVAEEPVPEQMQKDKDLWGECISGALTEEEFQTIPQQLGFQEIEVLTRSLYREVEGRKFWSVGLRGWMHPKTGSVQKKVNIESCCSPKEKSSSSCC